MEGYDVISSDEHKLGRVARVDGDMLIVEHGHLLKKHYAVPATFVHTDEAERVARLSVSKQLVEDSPEVENGEIDRRAIAEHYGLVEADPAPETLGEGDLRPEDPAWSEEYEERRLGLEPEGERLAATQKGKPHEPGPRGRQIIPSDPHE
jgi:hypothetical protein